MPKQVEIIKQVKLSSFERIAVVAAANNNGVLRDVAYGVRENLRYLGLVAESSLYTKAEILKRTEGAWDRLKVAVASKNAKESEDAISVIRSERWDLEKKVWKLTAAASEYLLKGRVIVTVGERNEAVMQKRA